MQLGTNPASVRVRNVISTADLKQPVDARIFKQYSWGRYDTEVYGGNCGYVKDTANQKYFQELSTEHLMVQQH